MGVSVRRCLVRDRVGRGAVAESLSVACPCACASVRPCALVCLRLCLCLPCPVPFCLRAVVIDWVVPGLTDELGRDLQKGMQIVNWLGLRSWVPSAGMGPACNLRIIGCLDAY